MSLRVVVAVPFRQTGSDRLRETDIEVALSLDRDWMTPDQASRVVEFATAESLLRRDEDGMLVPTFDPSAVTVPEDFTPDPALFQERSTFERVLGVVEDEGTETREAVAAINAVQEELGVSIEAAAVVYARRQDLEVGTAAAAARRELGE